MTEYTTGTGQKLVNIHQEEECAGRNCVVHNPSAGVMSDWPTHWRSDRGIMERLCPEHHIGHPDPDSPWPSDSVNWIHGCCMVCHFPEAASAS